MLFFLWLDIDFPCQTQSNFSTCGPPLLPNWCGTASKCIGWNSRRAPVIEKVCEVLLWLERSEVWRNCCDNNMLHTTIPAPKERAGKPSACGHWGELSCAFGQCCHQETGGVAGWPSRSVWHIAVHISATWCFHVDSCQAKNLPCVGDLWMWEALVGSFPGSNPCCLTVGDIGWKFLEDLVGI